MKKKTELKVEDVVQIIQMCTTQEGTLNAIQKAFELGYKAGVKDSKAK